MNNLEKMLITYLLAHGWEQDEDGGGWVRSNGRFRICCDTVGAATAIQLELEEGP